MSTSTLTAPARLAPGTTFNNGTGAAYGHTFNWHETLTVVRYDVRGYGVERYVVRNADGRHGTAVVA